MINKTLLTVLLLTAAGIQAGGDFDLTKKIGTPRIVAGQRRSKPFLGALADKGRSTQGFCGIMLPVDDRTVNEDVIAAILAAKIALFEAQKAESASRRAQQNSKSKVGRHPVQRQNWMQSGRCTGPVRTGQVEDFAPRRTGKGARAKLAKAKRNQDKRRS